MSPEGILGQNFDFKTDIWALGIISYSLLMGKHPFGTTEKSQVFKRKVVYEAFSFKKPEEMGLSEGFRDLVTKMLRKDNKNRLSIEQVLAHPWF
jgi:serine/threonine protein kinase